MDLLPKPTFQPFMAETGDAIVMSEWIERVEDGLFIDYNGTGYYGVMSGGALLESDIEARPSELEQRPTWATWVLWYNR